jgi:hypothetical protein
MSTYVPFPEYPPVGGSAYQRSRHPLIVFGPRGRLNRKSVWAAEELAVASKAPGEKYPKLYLGPWIPLELEANEEQTRLAFRKLLAWLFVAPSIEAVSVCVPRWTDLSSQVQERVRVAVGCQLQGVAGGGGSVLGLVPKADPLSVVYPVGPSPQLRTVAPPRGRFVTDPAAHLGWLQNVVPSMDELVQALKAFLGQDGTIPRTFESARTVATDLLTSGRLTRPQVQRYLEVFGFENSGGLVGVWPAKRLAEVSAATR